VNPDLVVSALRAAGCVFAEDEAALLLAEASDPDELARMVARRVAGDPLEHIVGWADFGGLRIVVEPGVFVPRRRTERLALTAASLAPPGGVLLDMCCGSGAVAALALTVKPLTVYATDIDPASIRCARINLPSASVHCGDLFAPLPADLRGRVDVLVANVPYVPTGAIAMMPPEARDHEPRAALDGGADGLDVARLVVAAAPAWLRPGGHVLFECSEEQLGAASRVLGGFEARVVTDEERGATVVVGQRGARGRPAA
jgi:release factor glutamine methyltransferase